MQSKQSISKKRLSSDFNHDIKLIAGPVSTTAANYEFMSTKYSNQGGFLLSPLEYLSQKIQAAKQLRVSKLESTQNGKASSLMDRP